MKLSEIKPNPSNPRVIKDEKFDKLKKSIKDFSKMLSIRPMIVDENNMLLGGNMRFRALQDLGYKEIPDSWVKKESELTYEEKKQFIIKDNVGFGEWDWQDLQANWDTEKLDEWGLDVPDFLIIPDDDELIGENKDKPPVMKITFKTPEQLQSATNDIQELIDRKYKGAFYSVSAGEL